MTMSVGDSSVIFSTEKGFRRMYWARSSRSSRGQLMRMILLKNLQLLSRTFFDWGWGQADQTQLRARQQLPTHRFCRL